MDEEGHTFPRGLEVEVCTDTAAKLSHSPYRGIFHVLEPHEKAGFSIENAPAGAACDPNTGCC